MRRDTALVAFLDILLIIILMVVPLINPPKEKENRTFPLTITLSYDDGIDVDIDSYLFMPDQKMVWYSNKDQGSAHLDKDDLGTARELMNREILIIDSLQEGEYYFSLHGYRYKSYAGSLSCTVLMEDPKGNKVAEILLPCPEQGKETPVWKILVRDGKIFKVLPSTLNIIPFRRKS